MALPHPHMLTAPWCDRRAARGSASDRPREGPDRNSWERTGPPRRPLPDSAGPRPGSAPRKVALQPAKERHSVPQDSRSLGPPRRRVALQLTSWRSRILAPGKGLP